jgi:UPF0755 protein
MRRRLLIAILVFGIVVIGLGSAWYLSQLAPPDSSDEAVTIFTVKPGDRPQAIAANLEKAGLIKSAWAFGLNALLTQRRNRLQAGTYGFSPSLGASKIIGMMAAGEVDRRRLTIIEGYRLSQIRDALIGIGYSGGEVDEAFGADYDLDILTDKPTGVSLEGYLFPDTYQINRGLSAKHIVEIMIGNLDTRLSAEIRQRLSAQGLTLHQALTLASIVEREVSVPADRPVVAQVLFTRLSRGMRLEVDPTVEYAAQLLGRPFDLDLDSPYNTYRNSGLPPGPIASPSLSAIEAVASPASTNYLYFLSGRDGKTYFSSTLAEHEANIEKYLR